MKAKYLKKNLKATKKLLKNVAWDYQVKVKWEIDPKKPNIYVWLTRKFGGSKHLFIVTLPEDKISYGKYKPAMVAYNVKRSMERWLTDIYESFYGKPEENHNKVPKAHKK